ncbi:CsbD family protein [Streptomyces zingiberis]|uniref:CsbD family protein n=1 Tax=Streptomyces zingiberis TaxID=2053010 RepID=UPI0028930BB1|nr:CsbD family protein [Streptomyces zingiberis]
MGGESSLNKGKGKAKEMAGKATGDERLAAEGRTDQLRSKGEDAMKSATQRAKGVADSLRHRDKGKGSGPGAGGGGGAGEGRSGGDGGSGHETG